MKAIIYNYLIGTNVIFVLGAIDVLPMSVAMIGLGAITVVFIAIVERLGKKNKLKDIE